MSIHRTFALLAIAALTILAPLAAMAAERAPFTQEAFTAAQQAGKSILVDVHAPWCPTCKAQRAVLDVLGASADYKDFVVLTIDFDTQKDAWKSLKARAQSTLIAFKGEKETGRLVSETRKDPIEALLKGAL